MKLDTAVEFENCIEFGLVCVLRGEGMGRGGEVEGGGSTGPGATFSLVSLRDATAAASGQLRFQCGPEYNCVLRTSVNIEVA